VRQADSDKHAKSVVVDQHYPVTAAPAPAVPWWLWPNVLALDAPAVAVVWQRFLGRAFGVAVPPAATVSLGLVVWGVYLADRWWDARSGAAGRERHRFAAEHPGLIVVAVAALAAALGFALALPVAYLAVGGALAALVAGYFGLVHRLRPNAVTARGGKEMLVGFLFAAGVAVPLAVAGRDAVRWLHAAAGFGVLCWLNCRVIDRWEGEVSGDDTREPSLGIVTFVFASLVPRPVAFALASAAALLLAVHLAEPRIGPRVARVLADLVLLTPLVVWVVL
jgi:hypothetical protein